MRRLSFVLGVTIGLASLVGCQNAPSYVVLAIDAQPEALGRATTLRVEISSDDGTLRRDATFDLTATVLPVRVPLTPIGGDASRAWIVEAALFDAGGLEVTSARARGGYEAGATREAGLCLYASCSGVDCGACSGPSCETCRGTRCSSATVTLGAPGTTPRCPDTCGALETVCSGGVDEDCDGRIDCADSDCACLDGGSEMDTGGMDSGGMDAGGGDTGTPCPGFQPENTVALCHDGLDNDCDGARDCAEGADCRIPEGPTGCDNRLDDDCDGMIDCEELDCARIRCGSPGERCCGGVCVDTFTDEANCGACGLNCDPARVCVRVPDGAGGLSGAGCRCAVTGDCARGAVCEAHDGQELCNCVVDMDCGGGATCRRQGLMHHTYCGY